MESFARVKMLIGDDAFQKLSNSSVAVFGVGGVGGYTVEALARSGVEKITVFDSDVVAKSNLNRQIIATTQNIGTSKVEAVKERVKSINPNAQIQIHKVFYLPENANDFDLSIYDYVVDAVDTVSAKLEIIERAIKAGVKVISCMGTGGKTDPTMLRVAPIEKTKGCPLARVMRRELKARSLSGVKVVYSEEQTQSVCTEKSENGKAIPPSMIFVPATAGLILAREVVFDIINEKEN